MPQNVQAVIQALIQANEIPHYEAEKLRKPAITISRDHGSGGDEIARALAERLDATCYDEQILDAISKQTDVHEHLMETLHEKVSRASDAWLYALIFGKRVTVDDYRAALVTAIRAMYRTGGIIMGRGGHLVLTGRDALRVRITGSVETCAKRIANQQHIDINEAKKQVRDVNKSRGQHIWEIFHTRLNDPTNFDLVINTDQFADYTQVVELIMYTLKTLGFDQPRPAVTTR